MKLYPARNDVCICEADIKMETTVIREKRGRPPRWVRAKKIFHARAVDADPALTDGTPPAERFWHWDDQEVVKV